MSVGHHLRGLCFARVVMLVAAALTVASIPPWSGVSAASLKTLYRFCPQLQDLNCPDGSSPSASLIMGASGRLYGTTGGGGAGGAGTVFELTPDTATGTWTEKVLYSFCSQGSPSCTDGASPSRGLIMDASGKLYGTTQFGGATRMGTVFELTPDATNTTWTEKVLYSFSWQSEISGLIMDGSGTLYVTTVGGGATGGGKVFELTPDAATGTWTGKIIYNFVCVASGFLANCPDGSGPSPRLIIDAAGKLYGTTSGGGAGRAGTVFELAPDAAKTKWTEKVLYSFCPSGNWPNCPDGATPIAGVITGAAGKLYGTTTHGGATNSGTVFELTPDAAKARWTERVLFSFCPGGANSDCPDGYSPSAGLIMDGSGNLYGMTVGGGVTHASGRGSGGTVFQLTLDAATGTWTETVLYKFCSQSGCTDGAQPFGTDLVMDASGNLYGTTREGGTAPVAPRGRNTVYGAGSAFELERQMR